MPYQLYLRPQAEKNLNKLAAGDYKKVEQALVAIARDPFIGKKLKGEFKDEWSYRVWPFRIIYRVYKHELLILVVNIGHRQGVYK